MNLSTVDIFKHIQSDSCIELTPQQLADLQKVLTEILKDIIAVCEENDLCYTLGGGSALGAVRHQGFIPWDDDIDLNMPRKDYLKFIDIFAKTFPDKYWVHTPEFTKDYNLLLGRVRLKGTSVVTREDFFHDECGAFVDIFIIENTFDNPVLRGVHGFGAMAFGLLHSCRKFYRERKYLQELVDDPQMLKVFRVKIAIGFLTSLLSMQTWTRMVNKWYGLCHNDKSQFVTIPCGRKHFFGELYLREDVCETSTVSFESLQAKGPKGMHTYLTKLYGDYTQIPDASEQERHCFFRPWILDSTALGPDIEQNPYTER